MSSYYWKPGRYNIPLFWKDDHPIALYAGDKRLSPMPTPALWMPTNWLACPVILIIHFLLWPYRIFQTITSKEK